MTKRRQDLDHSVLLCLRSLCPDFSWYLARVSFLEVDTSIALSPMLSMWWSISRRPYGNGVTKVTEAPQRTLLALLAPRRLAHLEKHALLGERRSECPGAVAVLVCHDEVVVGCAAEQAETAKAWLEKAMIEGMEEALNGQGVGGHACW